MRKNAINQQWKPIDGGMQAVDGIAFSTAVLPCPQTLFSPAAQDSITMFSSSVRCAAACVFSNGAFVDAYTAFSKNNVENGCIKALLLSDGAQTDAEQPLQATLKADFRMFADAFDCNAKEVCAVNIGKVGSRFISLSKEQLQATLTSEENQRQAQISWKQFAYTFRLGDVVCRMGAAFIDGAAHEKQTGAQSTVCCLATDVQITPQMLKKAFASAVDDTLNSLYLGVDRSPNDFCTIVSTCKAKNYCISQADSEYKKFVNALKHILQEIAMRMAKGEQAKRLFCLVSGAKSKHTARTLINAMLYSAPLRTQLKDGVIKTETLLCALSSVEEYLVLEKMQITLHSEHGEAALWDDGKQTAVDTARLAQIMQAADLHIEVRLHDGNYKASGIAKIRL